MSRDTSSFGIVRRNSLRNMRSEGNENEFDNPTDSIPFPPPRTPLNAIPDPSQYARGIEEYDPDSVTKFESSKVGGLSDGRIGAFDYSLALRKGIPNTGLNSGIHRSSARGKAHSEPNSAQSTPAKSIFKVSNSAALGICTGTRTLQYIGARGGTSSRVPRGISIGPFASYTEVPYFELVEDPSFWMDHNVQVLIRIRPFSTTERALQGYGRCLRQDSVQSLTWLGHPETRFTFDHIACETISQEELFKVVGLPMVENCMSGYNSCMFAYGQTGSGKTYTMMGEIFEMDGKLNEYCGLTPRIFEYLFMTIRAEEENRRDEKLKYSCKCSFLEIYNEQITDLLEPSSTNLQLREDMKKGVYVENLTEHEVTTVRDVVELLLQGAANRKMAATHMNSESSRSHSVFTCIIESRWDKDSMNHLRFARLNLVDLAGSERQKSSGAEGERLKEAANINKSLSTLGLVIMTLVDVAQGKHRHIPYRDSRLTFLLQDSLGGNSKTTIIANVSPSICSANETLSTLKFAQRAKLIQNNAKVNEDASGDVVALQREVQQLKGQLTILLKHHNLSRSPLLSCPRSEQSKSGDCHEECDSSLEGRPLDGENNTGVPESKIKCLEAALVGALRREKTAEAAVRKLEAEVEHMNHLVHQREEDAQCTKMMLRLTGEKIKRLELLADGLVSGDQYLMEENSVLSKEIQLLQARIDRNPELTRFSLENMRLLDHLRVLQDFYKQGERETLLAEVSEMRDQLLEALERNHEPLELCQRRDTDTLKELEDCRKNLSASIKCNMELTRKLDELQKELKEYLECNNAASHSVADSLCGEDSIKHTNKYSTVDIISVTSDSEHEIASNYQVADESIGLQKNRKFGDVLEWAFTVTEKELRDEGSLIETMESEQVQLVEELDILQQGHSQYMEFLMNKDSKDIKFPLNVGTQCGLLEGCPKTELGHQDTGLMTEGIGGFTRLVQQDTFDKMQRELEEARILNRRYQDNQASQLSNQHEAEQIRKQVEMETAETILHLQEELVTLEEKLCSLTQENTRLRNSVASGEDAIKALSEEWEKATLDLTNFLLEGCKSLEDASNHIESISMSFPQRIISEQAQRAAKVFVEKEKTILCLENSLEEAQKIGQEMKLKLSSLKGATLAITEVQQLENDQSTKEANQLRKLLNEKNSVVQELEKKLKNNEKHITEAVKRADAAFIIVKRLLDFQSGTHKNGSEQEIHGLIWASPTQGGKDMVPEMKDKASVQTLEAIEVQFEMTRQRVLEAESAIHAAYIDTQMHLSSLPSEILETTSIFMQLIQDLAEEIRVMKKNFVELKEQNKVAGSYMMGPSSLVTCGSQMLENEYHIVKEINDKLGQTNKALNSLNTGIGKLLNVYGLLGKVRDLPATDASSIDSFQLSSDPSTSRIALMGEFDETSSSNSCCVLPVEFNGFDWDSISERDVSFMLDKGKLGDSQKPIENLFCNDATIQSLRKDLQLVFNSFLEIQVHLETFFNDKEIACCPYVQGRCFHESVALGNNDHFHADKKVHDKLDVMEMGQQIQSFEQDVVNCNKDKEVLHFKLSNPRLVIEEGDRVNSFLNKCEEAQATMKEADAMLNALLKANETAKHTTDEWKQAGETLMVERACLVEEVQQLKASLYLKEEEYEFMRDQISSSLVEVTSSFSLLEGSFFQMQRNVEDWFKVLFSDIFSLRRDIWDHLHNSRSSLEDIWSSMMQYDFALFVLYQCHVGKHFGKIPILKADLGLFQNRQRECCSSLNNLGTICMNTGEDGSVVKGILEQSQNKNPQEELSTLVNTQDDNYSCGTFAKLKEDELSQSFDSLLFENLSLKRELSRKDVILKGLLFDLSLLQESAASANDKKTEMEQNVAALTSVQHELAVKTTQLDDILIQQQKLRAELDDRVAALSISNSQLEQAQATVITLSNQNTELRHLLEDLYVRKNSAEQQLEETNEVVICLEKEIIRLASSVEEKILTSIVDIENDLRRVSAERDCLYEEVISLNRKLEMANTLAEENEAIAIEARQESEASKIYAEQKEEEVKILERSVGELECTVDVLEKKVYEMSKEVERHHRMRDDLELELQALRHRMLTVETAAENMDSGNSNVEDQEEDQTSKHIDNGILERIRFLEMEKADQAEEIKQCKEYISELVLHAEAQATQYQQKYKALENMVREVISDPSTSTSAALTLDKSEKTATRTRGSSSPFRCIASLVQQMNSEKDQELSMAKLRIEDLEALTAKRHKEVCMLNARLSAAENMTHDVIRDLLGVKLDITNYANLIDQDQIQKLLEEAHRQTEESLAMEQEILKLRKKINDLTTERESCIEEINKREADTLAAQLTVEQLQQRNQLLAAQNEMLQMENTSLKRKSADLDEMLKKVLGSLNVHQHIQQPPKMMEQNPVRAGNRELNKRLAHSQQLLSRVNDELAWYCKSESSNPKSKGKEEQRHRNRRQESETKFE
ncbi:kinesin-like protein KIN-12E isoform X2 [Telopea speciosissima]|uniref:kinesin-like protein KIN-12E isoform X2 n=1 Tax=Telopea speciosissima TaxID=54955 RepID=UPI001CC64FD7|nr:kinesin-like protein KIN-12E isoform X2 [Telopea speciosissima]